MRQNRLVVALSGIVLLSASMAGYFAYRAANSAPPSEAEEIERLVREVGKKTELPTGETPTLATVTNRDRLDNQVFFQNAKNGDKILIYPRAGEAVLYRPDTGKILAMSGIDIEKWSSGTTPAKTEADVGQAEPAPETLSVALFNGTDDWTALDAVEKALLDRFPKLQIVGRTDASRSDYGETVVVDLTNRNEDFAQVLADAIGAAVSVRAPEGEANPDADFLVIVGGKP